jgi:long-chain acyl-CoA synthetase
MNVERTFDILARYRENFVKEDALCAKQGGAWIKYSTDDYVNFAYHFSYGLLDMGMKKGEKIITISGNRPEWNFVDMGMAMIGVIHVPVFTSLSTDEYKHIIEHSEASLILVSDKKLHRVVAPAAEACNSPVQMYSFDEIEGVKNWKEIVTAGKLNSQKYSRNVEAIKAAIQADDFASLIYTSGTTGQSKGVMLTHRNMVSNFLSAANIFRLRPGDKYLSILPLCHVGGRLGNYQTQYSGASIYYAENMGTIAANLSEIQADGFDAVPRVLEKFFEVILSKGNKLDGMKKKIFFWAVNLGLKYKPHGENGWLYERKLRIADKLIFSKWREALGGRVRIVGCGGASLQPRLERYSGLRGSR